MKLMTEQEASVLLNVSLSTLQKDRHDGRIGLPYLKIGKTVRYERSELEVWASSRIVITPKKPSKLAADPKKKLGRPTKIEQVMRRQKNLLSGEPN